MKKISRIAIIKDFDKNKKKKVIERIAVFYDDGSVDVQDYDRNVHLDLVADFLEINNLDILDDGLNKGVEANLISIINAYDKEAMKAFRRDVLEAKILQYGEEKTPEYVAPTEEKTPVLTKEAVKEVFGEKVEEAKPVKREVVKTAPVVKAQPEVKEEKKEEVKPVTKEEVKPAVAVKEGPSEEDKDLIRYFNLFQLREAGKITAEGLAEIRRLKFKNDKILAVEEARDSYRREHLSSREEFLEVYNEQRAALRKSLNAIGKPVVKEEAPVKVKKQPEELPQDLAELNKYIRLADLREMNVLPAAQQKEIEILKLKNERVKRLEDARADYKNNKITEEEYNKIVKEEKSALAKAIIALKTKEEAKVEATPVVEEKKEEKEIVEEAMDTVSKLPDEFKEVIDYRRKSKLRDSGRLPIKDKLKIEKLRATNPRVKELEDAREQLLAGSITQEEYDKKVEKQKKDLADAYKTVKAAKKEEIAKETVKVPVEKPAEPKTDKEEKENAPITESEYLKNLFAKISEQKKAEETSNKEEAIPVEGSVSDSEEKDPSKEFILVGDPYENESIPSERNKLPKRKTKLPSLRLNKKEEVPGKKVVGVIPVGDDPTVTEEEVTVPPIVESEHHEEGKVIVKKRNRVWGAIVAVALGAAALGAWVTSLIMGKKNENNKKAEVPTATVKVTPSPTPKATATTKVLAGAAQATATPTAKVTATPTAKPTATPTAKPTATPTAKPTATPTAKPTATPTAKPTATPTAKPTATPTAKPTATPTAKPTATPTAKPTATPTAKPTATPTAKPTATPTAKPTATPKPTPNAAAIVARSVTNYCDEMQVPAETREFLTRADVIDFLSTFTNGDQRKEVISALAFGYEMNYLNRLNGNSRTINDGDMTLKSFCFDFICAKAVVNGYTPEQMASAFGSSNVSYEELMDGFHNFYNMMAVYGINAVEIPPFRYLTNGETKDTKAFTQLFNSLAIVNIHRKSNTLTCEHTDDFIVTVDKLYGRGGGTQFTTEGAATLGMSLVNSYNWGQANIANGQALVLQKDHGVSRAGLRLGADEDGHWEIDGFNYLDLFTQANKGWGNEADYNDRCYKYRQRLSENLEKGRIIASGRDDSSRLEFADKLEENPKLSKYASAFRTNTYSKETLDEIYGVAVASCPEFVLDLNEFISGHNSSVESEDLVGIYEYAPKVDAFFGLGLRDDYDISEIMIYYVNQVYKLGPTLSFTDENGRQIGGRTPTGPGTGGHDPAKPAVPTPHVVVTTTEVPVSYEDLTPEEQHQVDEQIQQQQQQEDEQWEEQVQHAQETADDVTTQLHDGDITPEEAVQQLEEAGITVAPDYLETMEQIHEDEVQVQQEAEQQAQELTHQEEQHAEEQHQQEEQQQQQEHEDEEALIQQSLELENNPPAPAEPEQPVEPEQPEQPVEPEQPAQPEDLPPANEPSPDQEIDPEFGSDDEEEYTGKNIRTELEGYRNIVASLGDFGLGEDRGRSYTL